MSKLKLKRIIGSIYPPKRYGRKIVLLYHSIGNTPWGMPVHQFADQMKWISDHCEVMTFSELRQAKLNGNIQVAVSFDDGYQTLLQQANNIVVRHTIFPIVYINTGWIANSEILRKKSQPELGHYPEEYFLTWPEVEELRNVGWEIGSHGVNHVNFARYPLAQTSLEFLESKQTIEMKLNQPCLHFAYPFGRFSKETQRIVAETGYETAVAVRHGKMDPRLPQFALPRINIANEYSLDDFKQIVFGKWDYIGVFQQIKSLIEIA